MSNAETKDTEKESSTATSDLSTGITDVVNSAIEVGVALARVFAHATAGKEPVQDPPETDGAMSRLIQYGTCGVGNVVKMVVSGIGSAADVVTGGSDDEQQPAPGSGTTGGTSTSGSPSVHRGSVLRIPLSIENRGGEPMQGMAFQCLAMKGTSLGAGQALTTASVSFDPSSLDIAPRDFEKLTVFINTAAESAPGRYVATIGLGTGIFENTITFDVVA